MALQAFSLNGRPMSQDPHKLINEARVVSFDIFDTVILRGVLRPIDVFTQVALEGNEPPGSFTKLRVEAEQEARRRAWDKQTRAEVTLQEIYEVLYELAGWDASQCDAFVQLEEAAERRYCRRNPYLHSLYTYALQQDKSVIFVSDIYLDERLIRTILEDAGYDSYIHLFVSSTHGETKSNGGLYRVVLKSLDVPAKEILHIGDNMDSDVHMARKAGLSVWHYGKCSDQLSKAPALEGRLAAPENPVESTESEQLAESIWKGLVINRLLCRRDSIQPTNRGPMTDSFWEELGYVHVGLLYLGLASWLRRHFIEEDTDRAYFLSRDGYIMKTVYERLLASGAKGPSAHYLYASRRALNLAAIHEINETHTDFLVSGTSRLTVAQFLGRIGLESAEYIPAIQSVGLRGPSHRIHSGEDYGRLRALYRSLAPGDRGQGGRGAFPAAQLSGADGSSFRWPNGDRGYRLAWFTSAVAQPAPEGSLPQPSVDRILPGHISTRCAFRRNGRPPPRLPGRVRRAPITLRCDFRSGRDLRMDFFGQPRQRNPLY